MVSVVAVAVSQLVLLTCVALLDMEPVNANLVAVAFGSIPSYVLNRAWVWGKRGSHHLWREVVPFWGMAFLGLGFSTFLVHLAAQRSESALVVSAANLTAFGVLWVVKYLVFDGLMFGPGHHAPDDEDDPVTA
jgi:putative flippase GtrA